MIWMFISLCTDYCQMVASHRHFASLSVNLPQSTSGRAEKVGSVPYQHTSSPSSLQVRHLNIHVWFYSYKCYICLPISGHGLWEWLMILTLFARLTQVNVLHWIVGLYYYGFLVNESIGLILVIQTFNPSTLSVLYNKDVYPTSSIVWSTTFPFNIFKSH